MQVFANGLRIEVDDRGPRDGEAVLLIMGLGMQLIAWPEEMVDLLVARGMRVIRFDNRDIGLSQGFDDHGLPNVAVAAMRYALHLPVHSIYSLRDMARDALGVLDALGLARAHIVGASMGGMIAQHIAAHAPERVLSLTLLMTTTGARHLPRPTWRVRRELMSRPMGSGMDAAVAWAQRLFGVIGSPAYPMDPVRAQAKSRAFVQRAWHPAGSVRQLLAIVADGDRTPILGRIRAPTVVIHGEADPLVPSAAGRQLVDGIANAQADFIPGMGHDLPEPLLPRIVDDILRNAHRTRTAATSGVPGDRAAA